MPRYMAETIKTVTMRRPMVMVNMFFWWNDFIGFLLRLIVFICSLDDKSNAKSGIYIINLSKRHFI